MLPVFGQWSANPNPFLKDIITEIRKSRKPHWTTWAILVIAFLTLIAGLLELGHQFGVVPLGKLKQS